MNIRVEPGEVIGLLGPNGAGKTTIFYMIVGLVQPDAGSIFLGEENISNFPMHIRAQKGIGYLPQESSIFRKLSVKDNILSILQLKNLSRSEQLEKLDILLNELKISHISTKKGFMLSGGERRRVEITRALAAAPSFMLLDEPFAGIDPLAVADIQKIILHLKEKGIGILITDHNVRETLQITDRAYIINNGEILATGSPEEIVNNEKARQFYLGEKFKYI